MDAQDMNRRHFIKVSGTAAAVLTTGIEGIVAARRAPAWAQGTKLHIVRWVDFIPEADVELKRQAPEASKALGAEVTFEFINANDLQPRITAAIQSGSGADIIQMLWNWAQLYANGLVDVSDVADPIGKAQGGFYEVFEASARVGSRWLAVPHAVIGNAVAYRRSWFNEIGSKEFPKTWDEYREVGKKLKAKGKPVGQALGHSFGDPPTFAYPFLWDFGGAEVDKSGKKVAINSTPVTRAGWPGTTPTTTAPSTPARSARRSTAPRSTSSPSARRTRSRTTRANRSSRTSSTPR